MRTFLLVEAIPAVLEDAWNSVSKVKVAQASLMRTSSEAFRAFGLRLERAFCKSGRMRDRNGGQDKLGTLGGRRLAPTPAATAATAALKFRARIAQPV